MRSMFTEIDKLRADEPKLISKIDTGIKRLDRLAGKSRLSFLLKFLKIVRLHSDELADNLINDNLILIDKIHSEESARLLIIKSFFCLQNNRIGDSLQYVNRAYELARRINSKQAEVLAIIFIGYINVLMTQYKKAAAWYTNALEKCSKYERSIIHVLLGASYIKKGEFDRALINIRQGIQFSQKLLDNKSTSKEEKINQLISVSAGCTHLRHLSFIMNDYGAREDASFIEAKAHACIEFDSEYFKALTGPSKINVLRELVMEGLIKKLHIALFAKESDTGHLKSLYSKVQSLDLSSSLQEYINILFGSSLNADIKDQYLFDLMFNHPELVMQILSKLQIHFISSGSDIKADLFNTVLDSYKLILADMDMIINSLSDGRVRYQMQNIITKISNILGPREVACEDIIAEYDPESKDAFYTKNNNKLPLSERSYLILECLAKSEGQRVTKKELEQYLIDHKAYHFKNHGELGVRTYINRDLRKKLGLGDFIETVRDAKGGWKLVSE